MKLCVASDLHNRYQKVTIPECDIAIFPGDFTKSGSLKEIAAFNDWLKNVPATYRIIVAGNHEIALEPTANTALLDISKEAEALLTNGIYLKDSGVQLCGQNIWGSPWQPEFFNWAFNLKRGQQLADKWKLIPKATTILVTHSPPFGILDRTISGSNVGCEELAKVVKELPHLRLHCFGHIHYSYGLISGFTGYPNSPAYCNASICDERYNPVNPVWEFVFSENNETPNELIYMGKSL